LFSFSLILYFYWRLAIGGSSLSEFYSFTFYNFNLMKAKRSVTNVVLNIQRKEMRREEKRREESINSRIRIV